MESDATSIDDAHALAERGHSEFTGIELFFVNAGATRWVPFEDTTEAVYDELWSVNAKAPYFTVQKLAPLMGEGSAVALTTSVADVKGIPELPIDSGSSQL